MTLVPYYVSLAIHNIYTRASSVPGTRVMGWLRCPFSKTILQITESNHCFPQGFFKVKEPLKTSVHSTLYPDRVILLNPYNIHASKLSLHIKSKCWSCQTQDVIFPTEQLTWLLHIAGQNRKRRADL